MEQEARDAFESFIISFYVVFGGAWKLETGIIRDQRALIDGWEITCLWDLCFFATLPPHHLCTFLARRSSLSNASRRQTTGWARIPRLGSFCVVFLTCSF